MDKKIKDFVWWRNSEIGDLNDETARNHASAFITRLKLEMNIESAIGLPIDLDESNQKTNYIAIPKISGLYGIYIEPDKKINLSDVLTKVKSESYLKKQKPIEFNEIFNKANAVLPYLKYD